MNVENWSDYVDLSIPYPRLDSNMLKAIFSSFIFHYSFTFYQCIYTKYERWIMLNKPKSFKFHHFINIFQKAFVFDSGWWRAFSCGSVLHIVKRFSNSDIECNKHNTSTFDSWWNCENIYILLVSVPFKMHTHTHT